jgi:hypothetical protein
MPEPTAQPAKAEPSKTEGLMSLLSGKDGWMKIGVILIVLAGGGNILATKQGTDTTSSEVTQAIKEIHDVHDALAGSIDRQKQIIQMLHDLTEAKPTPAPQ